MSMKIDVRRPVAPPPAPKVSVAQPAPSHEVKPAKTASVTRDSFQDRNSGIVGPRAGSTFESGKTKGTGVGAAASAGLKISSSLQSALDGFASKLAQKPGEALSKKDFTAQFKSFFSDLKNQTKDQQSNGTGGAASGLNMKDFKFNGSLRDVIKQTYSNYLGYKAANPFSKGTFASD